MIKCDTHLHTRFSFDSESSMSEMADAAIEKGLTEIAITDHADFTYPEKNFVYPINFDKYIQECKTVKENYEGRLHITTGIEIGIGAYYSDIISSITEKYPFGFVIGSLHDYRGIDYYHPDFYKNYTKQEAYTEYFEEMIRAVKSCEYFSVLGHITYIERYGRYEDKSLRYSCFSEIITKLLKTVIEKGKGIEVNTSGYKYNLGAPHPPLDIIKRYKELGGEIITVGSDAHKPEHVAHCFKETEKILEAAGFRYVSVFRDREPVMLKI